MKPELGTEGTRNVSDTTEPDLLTIDRMAARLSLRVWTIRSYCSSGKLASVKIGRRVLIPSSEIDRLIGENLRPHVSRGE